MEKGKLVLPADTETNGKAAWFGANTFVKNAELGTIVIKAVPSASVVTGTYIWQVIGYI